MCQCGRLLKDVDFDQPRARAATETDPEDTSLKVHGSACKLPHFYGSNTLPHHDSFFFVLYFLSVVFELLSELRFGDRLDLGTLDQGGIESWSYPEFLFLFSASLQSCRRFTAFIVRFFSQLLQFARVVSLKPSIFLTTAPRPSRPGLLLPRHPRRWTAYDSQQAHDAREVKRRETDGAMAAARHRNDSTNGWIVQKFGGTSVGKFPDSVRVALMDGWLPPSMNEESSIINWRAES